MNDAKEILNQLVELYNKNLDNDDKHKIASQLWTKYYKLCQENHLYLEEGYQLYLMLESESYIVNQNPIRKNVSSNELERVIHHLNSILKDSSFKDGISMDDAKLILDWVVENTRKNFELLGISVDHNSLNGFCELGQALSIMPLEKLGLRVTKNNASDAFDYPFNHCFGTVTFPIFDNNSIMPITFLVDTTYRQFFSTVRCNEGRYYAIEENTGLETSPDPGYFMNDFSFVKQLMADGYILLDDENAKKYGEGFYLSSLRKGELRDNRKKDYFHSILLSSSDYKVREFELDGLNTDFPDLNHIDSRYIR